MCQLTSSKFKKNIYIYIERESVKVSNQWWRSPGSLQLNKPVHLFNSSIRDSFAFTKLPAWGTSTFLLTMWETITAGYATQIVRCISCCQILLVHVIFVLCSQIHSVKHQRFSQVNSWGRTKTGGNKSCLDPSGSGVIRSNQWFYLADKCGLTIGLLPHKCIWFRQHARITCDKLLTRPTCALCILLLSCHGRVSQMSSCLFMPAPSKRGQTKGGGDTAGLRSPTQTHTRMHKYSCFLGFLLLKGVNWHVWRAQPTNTFVFRYASLHKWRIVQEKSSTSQRIN